MPVRAYMALEEKYGEKPLKILFVGHNPSFHSWESGHYFSQPSNRFWKLLLQSGLADGDINALNDDILLERLGYGFTDVIRTPNSSSNNLKRKDFVEQRPFFYKRILNNAIRVKEHPEYVAFVGKRQFAMLFDPPLKRVLLGVQNLKPPGFPLDSQIWVLSSPSGRAVMDWAERLLPYTQLAETMQSAFHTSNIE